MFFENVDRIINSPASQRGRDFAIILASLSDLGYIVEWRIVNAADYGMPQRRRRTYIVGYREDSVVAQKMQGIEEWMLYDGVMAEAFPATLVQKTMSKFEIEGTISEVSDKFNLGKNSSPFHNAGVMARRWVFSADLNPHYEGTWLTLGGNLVDEDLVPDEYFISDEELPRWEYEKGPKKINRISKEGFEYLYSEGGMAFPDYLDRPSRTIITGEGGTAPSRFKHVVKCKSGRHRRLIPLELERLNMFPDNHTYHPEVSDTRRAFLMGNALVCGVVKQIGKCLYRTIYDEEPVSHHPIFLQRDARPMLDFNLFADEKKELVVNLPKKDYKLDMKKRLLIGLVKKDNQDYFLEQTPTKIYYTGKTRSFPSTIALNKLYYFMPYIKGEGVRDLYLIHIARIGTKAEVQPDSEDTEPRLVFDLEYLESLPDYVPVTLQYMRTYRDTVLGRIFNIGNTLISKRI